MRSMRGTGVSEGCVMKCCVLTETTKGKEQAGVSKHLNPNWSLPYRGARGEVTELSLR